MSMVPRVDRALASFFGFAFVVALCACGQGGSQVEPADSAPPGALLALAVIPLPLSPAFSPYVHDYVVRCAAGDNPLAITLQATAGAKVTVTTPIATRSEVSQGLSVTLSEDDPLIVRAVAGGTAESYWVRCLPHDFPQITFSPYPEAGAPTPGWYLTGNAIPAEGESGFAMILDGNGTPVWYERVTPGVMNVDLLPDGTVSYIAMLGDFPLANQYAVQTLAPWQTGAVQTVGMVTDIHELQELPNGDYLVFSYPLLEGVDLTGLAGGITSVSTLADCVIQEISPAGGLVWSWRATDHIDPVKESVLPETDVVNGQTVADVFHCNSIDVDASGNLLVSARHMDAVFYIDKASGTIVWKMGGTAYSKDSAQIITVVGDPEGTFNYQHDARFQPNGDVSLFDDHSNGVGVARGIEYSIDYASGTARPVWQVAAAVNSFAMGSLRRYPDGSNVIDWGLAAAPAFTEVDDQGNDVLDVGLGGDPAYRTVKVAIGTFDVDILRVTAGYHGVVVEDAGSPEDGAAADTAGE